MMDPTHDDSIDEFEQYLLANAEDMLKVLKSK